MARTVQDIFNAARDLSQQWDLNLISDGMPGDESYTAPGLTAYRALVLKLRELNKTGYNQCKFTVPLTTDTETYLLTRQAGTIRRAVVTQTSTGYEYPLRLTDLETLDSNFFGWKRVRAQRPTHYYFIGTKAFGIYPIVNASGYKIDFLADKNVAEPTALTSILAPLTDSGGSAITDSDGSTASSLPDEFFDTLAYGMAALFAAAANDWVNYGRLNKEWKEGYEGLVAEVKARNSPNDAIFELDILGRTEVGALGVRF